MVWLRALFQITAAAALAGGAALAIGGATRPPLVTNTLYASLLGVSLAAAAALVELPGSPPARWASRFAAALGLGLAAGVAALALSEAVLVAAGAADRAALCGSVARARGALATGLIAMLAGMLAKVLMGAVVGAGAGLAACRPLELPARGRALAAAGAIGGAIGGLVLELALWLAPVWRAGPAAGSLVLATAWLGAFVGLGLALGEELGAVARLRAADSPDLRLFAGCAPLGASEACALRLRGADVRPFHAAAAWRDGRIEFAAEPGAKLALNGRPVSLAAPGEGDEVTFGDRTFTVRDNPSRVRTIPAGTPREAAADPSEPPGPRLVRAVGAAAGETYAIPEGLTVLGAAPGCDVRVRDAGVAERHATILRRGAEVRITDEEGASGVRVDGRSTPTARLTDGCRLEIGAAVFVFLMDDEDERRRTDARSEGE